MGAGVTGGGAVGGGAVWGGTVAGAAVVGAAVTGAAVVAGTVDAPPPGDGFGTVVAPPPAGAGTVGRTVVAATRPIRRWNRWTRRTAGMPASSTRGPQPNRP